MGLSNWNLWRRPLSLVDWEIYNDLHVETIYIKSIHSSTNPIRSAKLHCLRELDFTGNHCFTWQKTCIVFASAWFLTVSSVNVSDPRTYNNYEYYCIVKYLFAFILIFTKF